MVSAEKTKNVTVARQATGSTFFRKAGEESFFPGQEKGGFFGAAIQPKLTISKPDDPYEKEADAVAETVMRMPESTQHVSEKDEEKLQRKEDEEDVQPKLEVPHISAIQCKQDEEIQAKHFSSIQREANGSSALNETEAASDEVYNVQPKNIGLHHSDVIQCSGRGPPQSFIPFEHTLQSSKGGGSSLPDSTRSFMEDRFSANFSGVRIHTGTTAQSLSSNIHAQAFTHGNDIYFNSGKYAPHTTEGNTLLAHELTHTIQQGASTHHKTTANTVSRKIIQRSAVPQLDNAVAKAKAEEGKVNANKEGADGFREGWPRLLEYFKTTFGEEKIVTAGAPYVPGTISEMDIKKQRKTQGMVPNQERPSTANTYMRDAMPSWCGIFAFWALNKGGVPMPKWQLGGRNITPDSARLPRETPQPGDIAYRNAFSHFALVEKVIGDTVTTINGNTSGENNLGAQVQVKDHPLNNWTAFFDPLKLKTGELQAGEGVVEEKPKTLRELRRELFNVNRKEDGGEDEINTGVESEVQSKGDNSNWHVNAKGELNQHATVQLQPEQEAMNEEDKLQSEPGKLLSPSLQMKSGGEFDRVNIHQGYSSTSSVNQSVPTSINNSSLKTSSSVQTKEEQQTNNRGPPVQLKLSEGTIQCGWFDSAVAFVNSAIDYAAEGLEAGKRLILNEARDFVMAIPGYRALRVVLGEDPITGEEIPRNGHTFIEAAFDIMPGGRLLHEKLNELGALNDAAQWIDQRIADVESIVHNVVSRVEQFWAGISLASLADPMAIFRQAGDIIHSTISNIIDFAVNAGRELLEIVKRFLLTQLVDFIRNHTTAYPLLKVILGQDPVTEEAVERNGTNILNALLELGGETGQEQRRQMMETGSFQRVAAWIDEGIGIFSNAYQLIRTGISNIWSFVTIDNLMHPVDTFNRIYNTFAEPIRQVWDFVERTARTIIQFIKEVLMRRLAEWARTVRGYALITVIIGEDPFTHEAVPRSVENIIRGFMSLMEGGEEQYNQLVESGAIPQAARQINAAVARLNMTVEMVIQLFIDLWNSFSLNDLADPIAAFGRILARFGEPIARLIAFVVEIVKIVVIVILQIMNFPFDVINNIITRTMEAFDRIKRDPINFLKNLLRAIKQGFIQFFDNIATHLLNGITGWLLGELRDANVQAPTDFSLGGIITWVLQILGISMERIWEKLAAHPRIGPQRVAQIRGMIDRLEGIWTFIKDVQQRGMIAIWEKIQEQLSNLWNVVLEAITKWIMEKIIINATIYLLGLIDPTFIMSIVNSVIFIYRAIQSFRRYAMQMLNVFNAFVNGVADIAAGNISTAANYLENTMGRAMPIVIGFLADLIGLGGAGRKVAEMIESVREMVDQALTWLVNKAVETGMPILERLMAMGRNVVGTVAGWLGLRKEFSTDNGQHHEIYFEGDETNRRLIVASRNPEGIDIKVNRRLSLLRATPDGNERKITACENAMQIKGEMDSHISAHVATTGESAGTTDIQPAINGFLERIKGQLIIGGVDVEADVPLTNVTYQMEAGKAKKVTAQPLTKLAGNTQGANVSGRAGPLGWEVANFLNSNRTTGGTTSSGRPSRIIDWRRVHLLSAILHGPPVNWNLTPTNQSANSRLSNIENEVSGELNANTIYDKYEVEIEEFNPSQAVSDNELGSWNTDFFPKKITLNKQRRGGTLEPIPISDALPAPDPVTLETRIDYYENKRQLIDEYFRTTAIGRRLDFGAFARNRLNLSRDIPELTRGDVTNRLRSYFDQNKNH